MKCSYCDAELNDSAKFCHKCGKAAKENKKSIMKVKFEKKWIYIAAGVILCACLFVFMNSLYKNAYSAQKYLSGIVNYINANAYREALEYYDLNPYVEKVDKSQMDNDELQLIALYYYADYLNFVTNISEEEMVSLEQYDAKYNNVIDMEAYLCSSAVKNIDMIHAEVTSCQYAPEKLDECLSGVFEGADLMQNTREAFLNKRKSMEERCEGYSVSELNGLYETEHKKWEEHVTKQQKLFDELYEKMGVDLLTDICYWSTDAPISLPINTREIDYFYKYSDEFYLGVRKWIAALEVSLSKLFIDYVEEHQYAFANSKQVTEPLPEYIVCDDGTKIIVFSHENFISGSIEYFGSFKKRYEAQESENLRKFIKDTILLWARKSKENLQDDILPNLEQICLLEEGIEVTAQNNLKTNERDTVSTNAVEETTQERIVVNPGDTVTGTIERRFSQSDDLIGGIDSEYYVLCFSKPVDLVVWDIEQQSEIIVEECKEIAVHAPQMGNMGNLDLEPYIGKQVSCWINASTTVSRIGMMAEVGNLNYANDNVIVQEGATVDAFVVSDEIKTGDCNSGKIQIGREFYCLGEKLSDWTDRGLTILSNTTVYDDCIILGINGEPICRLYVNDSGVMLEDATVKTICFGILYDGTIRRSNAEKVLNNPAPIACAGGIYLGMDYNEIESILGSGIVEETSEKTIASFKTENGKFFLNIDRVTGKICGIAYGDVLYW